MNTLPSEIVQEILFYFPLQDYRRLSLVDKFWSSIVRAMIRQTRIFKAVPSNMSVELRNEALREAFKRIPRLEQVDLRNVSYLESETLRALISNGQGASITHLYLRGAVARTVLMSLLRECTNLQALALHDISSVTDEVNSSLQAR